MMNECTSTYARALMDPFQIFKMNPCVPDMHAQPSQKFAIITRGEFSTGAQGVGYITVNPYKIGSAVIPAEGAFFPWGYNAITGPPTTEPVLAYCTNNLYGSTEYAAPVSSLDGASALGMLRIQPVSSMHADSEWIENYTGDRLDVRNNKGIQSRVVACGLRVRYIGTELYRSGKMTFLSHEENGSIWTSRDAELIPNTSRSLAFVQSYADARTKSVTKGWQHVTWLPRVQSDWDYCPNAAVGGPIKHSAYIAGETADVESCMTTPLFVGISGTQNAGGPGTQPFEYEIYQHVEIIGKVPRTHTPTDVVGLGAVKTNLPDAPWSGTAQSAAEYLIKAAGDTLARGAAGSLLAGAAGIYTSMF